VIEDGFADISLHQPLDDAIDKALISNAVAEQWSASDNFR